MLIYDGDSDLQKEGEDGLPRYPPSTTSRSTASREGEREKYPYPDVRVEPAVLVSGDDNAVREAKTRVGRLFHATTALLARWGLEVNGIEPIPEGERTDKRLYQIFFVWFSGNANIFTMSAGTVGPAYYSLGIRDSFYVILVVDAMYVQIHLCFPCVLLDVWT